MIACFTSGAISKQEAVKATVEGDANSEFSAALTTSVDDFIHKSLKHEQTECIRRIISIEDVLPVLPTEFGKSVITDGPRYVRAPKDGFLPNA